MTDKFFQDRDNAGKTISGKLMSKVEDNANDYRTVVISDGDTTTMLKTKGGMPEVTQTKKQTPVTTCECIKSPLTEIAFGYAASTSAEDANPFKAATGYRRWYGEADNGGAAFGKVGYNFSSDGILCIRSRPIQRMSFKDAKNQTVDLLFARKPEIESDAENKDYDADNTLTSVAHSRVAPALSSSRFVFAEGRYKYREWHPERSINLAWAFSNPAMAVFFLCKRLKSITFRFWDNQTGCQTSNPEKTVKWSFMDEGLPVIEGTKTTTTCANQDAREPSFAARSYFATNGHLFDTELRVGLAGSSEGTADIHLKLKRPGGLLTLFDPEKVVPASGQPDITHPGYATAHDLLDFAAFGNPYHGFVYKVGNNPAILYKDATQTATWAGITPVAGVYPIRYYNFSGKDPLDEKNIVRKPSSDEAYYPDAVFADQRWNIVPDTTTPTWSQLNWDEMLYKDPAGTVWVIMVRPMVWSIYPGDTAVQFQRFGVRVDLVRRYGEIGTDFRYDQFAVPLRIFIHGSPTFAPADWTVYGAGYFSGRLFVASDGKSAVAALAWAGTSGEGETICCAYRINLSGSGATDASEGVAIGDGISCTGIKLDLAPFSADIPNYFSATAATQAYGYVNLNASGPGQHYVPSNPQSIVCGGNTTTFYDQHWTRAVQATTVSISEPETRRVHDFFYEDGTWKIVWSKKKSSLHSYARSFANLGSCVDRSVTHSNLRCEGSPSSGVSDVTDIPESGNPTVTTTVKTRKNAALFVGNIQQCEVALIEKVVTDTLGGSTLSTVTTYETEAGTPYLYAGGEPQYHVPVPTVEALWAQTALGVSVFAPTYHVEKAWSVYVKAKVTWANGNLEAQALTTTQPGYVCKWSAVAAVTADQLHAYKPSTAHSGRTAKVGFAYNYRTKDMITVPEDVLAIFV